MILNGSSAISWPPTCAPPSPDPARSAASLLRGKPAKGEGDIFLAQDGPVGAPSGFSEIPHHRPDPVVASDNRPQSEKADPMTMIQLVYASRPFGFDESILRGILLNARTCNVRDGITGALICRSDLYLQMLEGPTDKVDAAYTRIERDDRHMQIRRLMRSPITSRIFGDWAMRSDPAHSWMWSREQVEDGAAEKAQDEDVLAVFSRLRQEAPVPTGP